MGSSDAFPWSYNIEAWRARSSTTILVQVERRRLVLVGTWASRSCRREERRFEESVPYDGGVC